MTLPLRSAMLIAALVPSLHRAAAAQVALPTSERDQARDVYRELVEIVTTDSAGNTPRAAQAMANRLTGAGLPAADVHVLTLNPQVGMLVARLRGRGTGRRPILLMAHLDVVPAHRADWTVDPYTFLERDGWFYGRGTSDNKAGAAGLVINMMRWAREGWRPERDVIIVLTGDEETSGASIDWLLRERRDLVDAELALNTDAGGVDVIGGRALVFTAQAAEKVYADFALEVTDAGGHSSLPRAVNPINTLAAALARIGSYRFPLQLNEIARAYFERNARIDTAHGADMRAVLRPNTDRAAEARLSAIPHYNARLRTTCVATRVEAGHANNALPQRARANVNCRIMPGTPAADVEAQLRRLAGDSVRVTPVNPARPSPPSPLPPDLMGTIERLAGEQWPGITVIPYMETGATDGLSTRNAGIPTYGLSAVANDPADERAHGRDERVGVEAFYGATQFWYRMVKALAGETTP